MKCYYEVLQVERTASDSELKLAYRKQALKWHPDKNIDNLAEATETFKLIQQAYDVLSDPQERAFYDRHRESILKGGHKVDKEELVDVYQYFTASCYSGYSDHEDGFYAVYRGVFEKIADEEGPYVDDEVEFACFGDSQSSYEDVVRKFYLFWEAFCTELSFEWLDEHEPCKDYGRRGNRFIMKENQKVRDAAKKERNEQIRSLVKFVKKRDRRVKAYLAKIEEEKKERQQAQQQKREQQKRDKLKKMEEYKEAEWMSLAQLEEQLAQLELEHEQNIEEEDPLYCIACDKAFMSTKSFDNHVRSKKHRENVAILKHLMEEEERALNGTDATDSTDEDEIDDDEDFTHVDDMKNESESEAVTENVKMDDIDEEDGAEEDHLESMEDRRPKDRKAKKKQRRQFVARFSESEAEETDAQDVPKPNGSDHSATKRAPLNPNSPVDASRGQESAADTEAKEELAAPAAKAKGHKAKEAKRKAREQEAKAATQDAAKEKENNLCATCNTVFPSRNKMFEHLKRTNHAQYLGSASSAKARKGRR